MNRWMKTKPSASKGTAETLKHKHSTPASSITPVDAQPLLFRSDELMAKPLHRLEELGISSCPGSDNSHETQSPLQVKKRKQGTSFQKDPRLSRGDTAAPQATAPQQSQAFTSQGPRPQVRPPLRLLRCGPHTSSALRERDAPSSPFAHTGQGQRARLL